MAARRSALNGVSAWEREEKAHQQRDYAAQLQEQILQKQVRLEQEKARRQQEQRDELEIIERERATANRQRQQHQKTELSLQVSLSSKHTKSSPGVESQQHGAFMVPAPEASDSPPEIPTESSAEVTTTDSFQHNTASGSMSSFKYETYTPAFGSAPSIFESLIREPGIGARSIAFYENLTNLQKLCTELEAAAAQKRREVQDCYVKPNFHHRDDDSVSLPTALQPFIQINDNDGSQDEDEMARMSLRDGMSSNDGFLRSSLKGLHGESVLLPLTTINKSLDFSRSEAIKVSTATLSHHPMEPAYDGMTLDNCLENQSEMLPFSA